LVAITSTLVVSGHVILVTTGQVVAPAQAVVIGTHLARVLCDPVPARRGHCVASGVGAATWAMFLPSALGIDAVSERIGVHTAGRLSIAVSTTIAALLHLTRPLDPTAFETVVDLNDTRPAVDVFPSQPSPRALPPSRRRDPNIQRRIHNDRT
jgi:hypothetical protein